MVDKHLIFLTFLTSIMLVISTLIIVVGRTVYGVDAFILAIMGYFFVRSIEATLYIVDRLLNKEKDT